MKKTEEVLPQYEFAERSRQDDPSCRTSPAPSGGTIPKGEGLSVNHIDGKNPAAPLVRCGGEQFMKNRNYLLTSCMVKHSKTSPSLMSLYLATVMPHS